jgi:hypothetical protein
MLQTRSTFQRLLVAVPPLAAHPRRRFFSSSAVNGYATEHRRPATAATTKDDDNNHQQHWIQGQVLDLAADLRAFRPGDKLDIPYELTVSESLQDFWQSVRWIMACLLTYLLTMSI